jgi:hypothetical protein
VRPPRILLAGAVLLAVCCSDRGSAGPRARGPYVVTAIDYHFHDAHPSLPIRLDRAVQFSNQGRNRHNVTIEGTDYDRTLAPGQRITIDPIRSVLGSPGRYAFVCRLHADRGMSGVLILVR